VIVVRDELRHHRASLFDRQRHARPQAIAFQRAMPTFDLAVALRIVGTRADVRHSREANELLEILRHELRTVVADDAWRGLWEGFPRALQDDLHVGLFHLLAQLPMHEEAAATV